MDYAGIVVIVTMMTAGLVIFGGLTSFNGNKTVGQHCPCSDARLCERIKDTTRKEVRFRRFLGCTVKVNLC